jgi:hypothetical protein
VVDRYSDGAAVTGPATQGGNRVRERKLPTRCRIPAGNTNGSATRIDDMQKKYRRLFITRQF